MSSFRSAGWSVSGSVAASSARSIPYLAISSVALAVSASASARVTPSAAALASSLRTLPRSAFSLVIDEFLSWGRRADAGARGPGGGIPTRARVKAVSRLQLGRGQQDRGRSWQRVVLV